MKKSNIVACICMLLFIALAFLFVNFLSSPNFATSETPKMLNTEYPPNLYVWQRNVTGQRGFNNIAANVQQVRYSNDYVYINSSGVPIYQIGPWLDGNPDVPRNQNFTFKIPRRPVPNNNQRTSTPLGPIGIWRDGVTMFNALDARSYNNQNIWHQNAVVAEASGFDSCLGHPAPGGVYHHHQNPRCHYNVDATAHSPLIGYAFDGFPIYGAYGHANSNGTGGIKRMQSGYRLRNITQRRTLPDGTVLQPAQYGPDVSPTFPLGLYLEDFQYVAGTGDLDQYNGRFAITPEYPNGIYAYYATLNADGSSAFPYILGSQYYGVVALENIVQRGRVTISEPVTAFQPRTRGDFDGDGKSDVAVFRANSGEWFSLRSQAGFNGLQWGQELDKPTPADFDGDGKTDVAVFRPATGDWHIIKSSDNSVITIQFGVAEDLPRPADFDGDGRADLCVFRPSNGVWYRLNSNNGQFVAIQFGLSGDVPQPSDFDGDGLADINVFRPSNGTWYRLNSGDGGFFAINFGQSGDVPTAADYDGDGESDVSVWRSTNGFWYRLNSQDGQFAALQWGVSGDVPVVADYDGDGKADLTVYRDGNWYTKQSINKGFVSLRFGNQTDVPVLAAYNQN